MSGSDGRRVSISFSAYLSGGVPDDVPLWRERARSAAQEEPRPVNASMSAGESSTDASDDAEA